MFSVAIKSYVQKFLHSTNCIVQGRFLSFGCTLKHDERWPELNMAEVRLLKRAPQLPLQNWALSQVQSQLGVLLSFCAQARGTQGQLASPQPSWETCPCPVVHILFSGAKAGPGGWVALGHTDRQASAGVWPCQGAWWFVLITPFQCYCFFASKISRTRLLPPYTNPRQTLSRYMTGHGPRSTHSNRINTTRLPRVIVFLKIQGEKSLFISREIQLRYGVECKNLPKVLVKFEMSRKFYACCQMYSHVLGVLKRKMFEKLGFKEMETCQNL